MAGWPSAAGHIEDDTWQVERLLQERDEGAGREFLVRWSAPWTEAHDSWEPAARS